MSLDVSGVENVGEFYSDHYLHAVLEGDLKQVFKAWGKREKEHGAAAKSPVKRLAGLAEPFFKAQKGAEDARGTGALVDRFEHARRFHALFLEALGYRYAPTLISLEDGRWVPVLCQEERGGRPFLAIVDAPWPEDEDDDPLDQAPLPEQVPDDASGSTDEAVQLAEDTWRDLLAGPLLTAERAPRWVIFLAGSQALLIQRGKWATGQYLHFNLAEIFGRREKEALKVVAGLLHKDVLNPDEGACLLETLDENSHKHAYGVSTDLKHGVREAIEILGNEVIRYRREKAHQKVFGADGLDAQQLTRECVVYLYRLLFLFYVEARGGELGIVPMRSKAYRMGYSLESLRGLELVPLTTEEAREGTYLHESLERLFELVNRGCGRGQRELTWVESDYNTFSIHGLRSALFDRERTPYVSAIKLRNEPLQRILQLLSLSKEKGRKDRGRISYATLGINQLGAVYEGLLSYTGFFAQEDLVELKHADEMKDPDSRSFFVPTGRLEEFKDEEIVKERGCPKIYAKGSYVFRLSGRDREKSASYYTPEELTKLVVQLTVEERIGTDAEPKCTADQILELKILEPAMGSGAFLNEAVNRLADSYLSRKQKELEQSVPPEDYLRERQKVKHHLAVHNAYGVDLNPLAAELGKLSLWLNVLHEGAQAPYLDPRIAVGNSLIGARRAFFSPASLEAKKKSARWTEQVPETVPLGEPRPKGAVYHFLVADAGMLAHHKDKVLKKLEPERTKQLSKWLKAACQPYTDEERAALERLSARIDTLWEEHLRLRQTFLEAVRQPVGVWGQPPDTRRHRSLEECEEEAQLGQGPKAPGWRLKAVMDYWCALWAWPTEEARLLPTRDAWLLEVDALLQGDLPELVETHTRLGQVRRLAQRLRPFHWELLFPEVLANGEGFDLVLGNPPWVRVEWKEQGVLGDLDPLVVLRGASASLIAEGRKAGVEDPERRAVYLAELEEVLASKAFLNANVSYELLGGVKANLYKCFVVRALDLGSEGGVNGFVHATGMYDDPKGGRLRAALAERLRWRLHFLNQKLLFSEITNQVQYEVSVYSNRVQDCVRFSMLSSLVHPETVRESRTHTGHGVVPGVKNDKGQWSMRGHASRIVRVDEGVLRTFAKLYDPPCTPASEARLPLVQSVEIALVLKRFAEATHTLRDIEGQYFTTQCLNETNQQKDGTIRRETCFPRSAEEWIVSGPHFHVANPFNKTPNEGCQTNRDYSMIDLSELPPDYLPRTNYVPACPRPEYKRRLPHWQGLPVTAFYRHANRRRVPPTGERSLVPVILPPGPAHVHAVFSIVFKDLSTTVLFSGLSSSLPFDFFVKASGKADLYEELLAALPLPRSLQRQISARTLRLNCLTRHYAELWTELWPAVFRKQSFTWAKKDHRLLDSINLPQKWTLAVPLRTPYERRQALVELDALAALSLGLTPHELCTIYRVQFPVLRQYENETFYDQRGKIVFTVSKGLTGVGLNRKEWEQVRHAQEGEALPDFAEGYLPPFDPCDREADMRQAYSFFQAQLEAAAP